MSSAYRSLFLSALLPGAGQWVNGERAKALVLWCMMCGIGISAWLAAYGPAAFRSRVSLFLLAVMYLCTWGPGVSDAYHVAAGSPQESLLSGTRQWYVVFLLLTLGPTALPFLWQSPAFSRRAKWSWTAAVLVTAAVSLWVILLVGPWIERALQSLPGAP